MAYADCDFYKNTYCGDLDDDAAIGKWLDRASDELDIITHHRLECGMPRRSSDELKVKKAVCAVAEALYQIDQQLKAASASEYQGQLRSAVASISSGRESISFAQGSGASVYAKAAADGNEKAKLLSETAARYLAGVPDVHGVNLLYAGW